VENDDTCVTDGQKVGEKKQCGRTCDGLFWVRLSTSISISQTPRMFHIVSLFNRLPLPWKYAQYSTLPLDYTAAQHKGSLLSDTTESSHMDQSHLERLRAVTFPPPAYFLVCPASHPATVFIWMLVNITSDCTHCTDGGWQRLKTETEGNKTVRGSKKAEALWLP
jgi:hypothetical protein